MRDLYVKIKIRLWDNVIQKREGEEKVILTGSSSEKDLAQTFWSCPKNKNKNKI